MFNDYASAAANVFLATKISFINAMAEIAEVTGAYVTQLADAIGFDARIGRRFLNARAGIDGGCLPMDIRAITARAKELGRGESVALLKEVDAINQCRRSCVIDVATAPLGVRLHYGKVAVQAAVRRRTRLPPRSTLPSCSSTASVPMCSPPTTSRSRTHRQSTYS